MLLFRDTVSNGGTRIPAWLAGCPELQRAQTLEGDVLFAGDPLLLAIPAHLDWVNLDDDGWQVACNGNVDFERYRRIRPDIESIPVKDCKDRLWFAPAVLDGDGQSALPMPWGKVDGVRIRRPTPEQQQLLTAATAARSEILSNKLATVPIDVIAEWVHALLSATYYLSGDVIDALEILDDTLAARVLLAAAGYPEPIKRDSYVSV